MADVNCVFQLQRPRQFGQVVSVRVQVVAAPRLARTSMTATIVRDAAVTFLREDKHLVLEFVGA
jgi:hypothetical protein